MLAAFTNGAAMRNLLVLFLGIAVGAACAAVATNSLARRDAYPRGVMAVMQQHYAALRDAARAGKCTDRTIRARQILGMLVDEIDPAFSPDATTAAPFREYTDRLRAAVDELPEAAGDCAQLGPAVSRIGNACDQCHQQYR